MKPRGDMMRRLLPYALACALIPVVGFGLAALPAHAACATTAPTSATATALATRCRTAVQVTSATTETTQVAVNPDGTSTIEVYAQPQRVRRADGSWTPLDATLVRNGDGSYSPRAATVDMTFS